MKLNKLYPLLLSAIILSFTVQENISAKEIDIGPGHSLQYSGYVGWQQLWSNNELESTYNKSGKPELGLNLIYDRGNFQIFNQFRYGETSDVFLVYNFAQYTFNLANDLNFTVKGGKLRHEVGLYNTTRVNPRTRQGVIQPQSVYWDVFDELVTSGVGVSGSLQYKDFEFYYTIDKPSIVDNEKTTRVFSGGFMLDTYQAFGSHQTAGVVYSPKNLPLLVKFSWAELNTGKNTSKLMNVYFPNYANKTIRDDFFTFGAEYKWDKLTLSGEALWFRFAPTDWLDNTGKKGEISTSYSLSAVYELTEKLSVRANYNEAQSDTTINILPSQPERSYRKDYNLGFRYYINQDLMVQAEGHYIQGARTMDNVDVNQSPLSDWKDWWMVGTNVVYFF